MMLVDKSKPTIGRLPANLVIIPGEGLRSSGDQAVVLGSARSSWLLSV
jgi:hypothetical protein